MNQQNQKNNKRISITALLLGALFAAFLVVGRSFRLRTDFSLITEAPWKAALLFVLFWVIFTAALTLLYHRMDSEESALTSDRQPGKEDFRHPVLMRMLLLLLMWGLFQIWFMPGNIPSDPRRQLSMFLDYSSWNTHHPFFATVTVGSIYWAGLKIGGQNLGTFFCVFAQDLLGAFTFASMLTYVRRRSRSRALSTVCLLFVGLVPAFPAYLCSLGKDAFYLSYLGLFLLSYVRILLKDEMRYTKPVLVVAGTLACMQRHDALYLVIPTLFVLIFLVEGKHQRKMILLSFAAVLFLSLSERMFVSHVLNLHTDRQTEALSIPLQQIARYVSKHEGEQNQAEGEEGDAASRHDGGLTQEEIGTIDAVIEYEGLAERYDPTFSDPVKNRSRKASKEDWNRFFRLWAQKLSEDPVTFIEATMNFVFGYTDPYYVREETLGMYISHKGTKYPVFASYLLPKPCQQGAKAYVHFWRTWFPLRLFMAAASYCWICLILLGAVLRRKGSRKYAMIFVFPLLAFAICVASPISGSMRYSMPVLTALPLFLLVTHELYRKDGL